jgi:hypothetical protein
MKLYTEEQVKHAIKMARSSYNLFTTPFIYEHDEVLEQLTPIELPSDEEIEKFAFEKYHDIEDSRWYEPLQVGAKWMRNKIGGDI